MSLRDKPVYPYIHERQLNDGYGSVREDFQKGLTFREALIISLASNPVMIKQDKRIINQAPDRVTKELVLFPEESAEMIIRQADAIIKELEK
jgi:hypothetical protein